MIRERDDGDDDSCNRPTKAGQNAKRSLHAQFETMGAPVAQGEGDVVLAAGIFQALPVEPDLARIDEQEEGSLEASVVAWGQGRGDEMGSLVELEEDETAGAPAFDLGSAEGFLRVEKGFPFLRDLALEDSTDAQFDSKRFALLARDVDLRQTRKRLTRCGDADLDHRVGKMFDATPTERIRPRACDGFSFELR